MNGFFSIAVLTVFLWANDAGAVSINIVELAERMDKIETAVKGVQKKLSNNYVGAKQPAVQPQTDSRYDALLLQVQENEQTLRLLTGEIETIKFNQEELKSKIERLGDDASLRFSDLEKRLDALENRFKKMDDEKTAAENAVKEAEKKKKEQRAAAAKAAKEKDRQIKEKYGKKKPKELYDEATAAVKKQQYKTAQTLFEAFLHLYPKNALAGNAQYWLGETYFARNRYADAAVAFADGFQNYRDSQKAPDNLFKLGVSLAKLKKKKDACTAFASFAREYPKVAETMKKRLDAEVKALACQ